MEIDAAVETLPVERQADQLGLVWRALLTERPVEIDAEIVRAGAGDVADRVHARQCGDAQLRLCRPFEKCEQRFDAGRFVAMDPGAHEQTLALRRSERHHEERQRVSGASQDVDHLDADAGPPSERVHPVDELRVAADGHRTRHAERLQ